MNKTRAAGLFLCLLGAVLAAENYSFESDSLRSVLAEGREETVLEGNVLISSEEKEISADKVRLSGEDFDFFLCEGDVLVVDKKQDFSIRSQLFHYDNRKKIIRINAPVVMEDRRNDLVIKSGYMENRERENRLVLQIGVRILKEDLACRSEFAVYHREENLLELTGLPVVYRGDDVFRASRITVDLDTDEIKMEGEVQGSLLSEDKEAAEELPPEEAREEGASDEAPPGRSGP